MYIAQELSLVLDVIQPVVGTENCVIVNCCGCYLVAAGAHNLHERWGFVCRHSLTTSCAVVKLGKVQCRLENGERSPPK